MNFIIRKAEEKDVREMCMLNIEDWKIFFKGIIHDEFLDSLDINKKIEKMLLNMKKHNVIVAVEGEKVLGFCRYSDNCVSFPDDNNIGSELCAIYVKAELVNGNGIGKALFEYAKNDLMSKGKNNMIVCCFEENYPARKFYERMGGEYYRDNKIEVGGKPYKEAVYLYNF